MRNARTVTVNARTWAGVRTRLGNTITNRNNWRDECTRLRRVIDGLRSDLITATRERDQANRAANTGAAQEALKAANTAIVERTKALELALERQRAYSENARYWQEMARQRLQQADRWRRLWRGACKRASAKRGKRK